MNNDAVGKITMMRDSFRCFIYGLLGLLPGFGVPFACVALVISGKVRIHEKQYWNAAKPYRVFGVLAASGGTIFWLLIAIWIAYNAYFNPGGGGDYDGYGDGGGGD
jgi:hypothetical protein